MSTAAAAAIELADVTVHRDGRLVLDVRALAIRARSIHVVIGANGAGKSTLLAAMLGEVAFAGRIALHYRGAGTLAYVPQGFVGDRTLPITVAEFLALQRQRWPVCFGIRPAARARIAAVLARVGLAGFEARRLGELSGGELRRVLIGNAIEPAPEILLCDEPATGLDAKAVEQLDALLRELRDRDGTTVVIVSHDRAQVRRIADDVTRLNVIVEETGAPALVLDHIPDAEAPP